MSSSAKIGVGNAYFVFAKTRKFWLDSLLLFPVSSSPDVPISSVSLLIHLAIANVSIISVFANLLKNYFKPLYCRDKRSITKIDKLLRKLFGITCLSDISHRSKKKDLDGIQIFILCRTKLLSFIYE